MKKVFIVHGWSDNPKGSWFPWLKKELENQGFQVKIPKMPNPDEPKIETWIPFLKEQINLPDKETYLIGHSIGCQTIMRYLESLPKNTKIGGAIFVAGFFTLTNLEKDEEQIAKPWLETPIDLEKVKSHSKDFIAILSDNDPYVPLEKNLKIFKEKLGAKTITEKGKGHFSGEEGITKIPSVSKAIERIS